MLRKYIHIEYFIASDEEFLSINNFEVIFALMERYGCYAGYGVIEMVYALSRLFFKDEEHLPKELVKKIPDASRFFKYNQDFINKIASFEKDETNSFAYRLREDEY